MANTKDKTGRCMFLTSMGRRMQGVFTKLPPSFDYYIMLAKVVLGGCAVVGVAAWLAGSNLGGVITALMDWVFSDAFGVEPTMASKAFTISALILILWYIVCVRYDFNGLKAFWLEFDKSEYKLATGTTRKEILGDEGLQGEFMAYTLSRELTIPHRTLYNVCVPMPNGNFQEIDAIIITRNLIYVIECKNRAGIFAGDMENEDWVQYIGQAQNATKNIYMQNQKHTMALEHLLLEAGLLSNGVLVEGILPPCLNIIFQCGNFNISSDSPAPVDMMLGDKKQLKKEMESVDANSSGGSEEWMNSVYEALLPFSLYTGSERRQMMEIRRQRSENKEFMVGEFRYAYIEEGIPGISKLGEPVEIRKNMLYTQVKYHYDGRYCWITRTDIPKKYSDLCR